MQINLTPSELEKNEFEESSDQIVVHALPENIDDVAGVSSERFISNKNPEALAGACNTPS